MDIRNSVTLIGRLTSDPAITYGQNQTAIAKYTIAIDRPKKQGEEQKADFIRCVAFGNNAEFADKYLQKGMKIGIGGHIQTGSYTDGENRKVYTTDVIVDNQTFCESKNAYENAQDRSEGSETNKAKKYPTKKNDGFMDIAEGVEDEELPFN